MKRIYSLALIIASFLLTPAAPGQAASPVPVAPAAIGYRYWPRQFVQWVGSELPYSMIVLAVDDRGSTPIYDVTLTDRASGRHAHYTNQQAELAIDKAIGLEAYLVPMQFDAPAQAANGSTYLLRFVTETGSPVAWQFVQGSDISEQGSGVSAFAAPSPFLLYREQGAVAGEGTALKVGSVTSTAEVWKEISQPPYFVAYHGALSQDVHEVVFLPRSVEWKVTPAAASVTAGADWNLTDARGMTLSAHVDSIANGTASIRETNALLGTAVTLDATKSAGGWALTRVRYGPQADKGQHGITVTFTPALGETGSSKFEVVAGKKTHLATGNVTGSAGGKESWSFTQPTELAHSSAIDASVVVAH